MGWLDARIADLWRWPRTAIRDFWRRAGRLAAVVRTGRSLPLRWRLHAFACHLFDLAGGPELAELLLRLLLPSTPLSVG